MAETLLSPGVLARENDQSFITQQPAEVGAAIIGPAALGPVEVPTLVTSYSEYTATFGTTVQSASVAYSYLTSLAANNYFQSGGTSLLVTRVTPEAFSSATSSLISTVDGSELLTVEIRKSYIDKRNETLKNEYQSLLQKQEKVGKELQEKYGEGSIDLEKGELVKSE
jgi:hypothetical protein